MVRIGPRATPNVNAVSVFSGTPCLPPPFFNPIYRVATAGDPARQVGLYLWGWDSEPLDGVTVQAVDSDRAFLVRGGTVIGFVNVDAPDGSRNHALTDLGPSIIEPAVVTGVDTGRLLVQLTTDAPGDYVVSIRMIGGNLQQLFVAAG
ncbi:MAG: hypothetical protein OEM97_06650 [Acidimicrobiia bacterium]|nr:hypothetical protein [Acidimicrobiia bacterium]